MPVFFPLLGQEVLYSKHWGFDPVLTIRSVHCPLLGTTQHARQPFRHLKCSALSKCWMHFMHDEPWKQCCSTAVLTAFVQLAEKICQWSKRATNMGYMGNWNCMQKVVNYSNHN